MVGSSSGWTEARRDEGAARRELTGSRKQRTVQGCLGSNISAQQELRPQRAPPSERRRFLFLWARTGTALPAAAPEWQADRRQCHSCRRWSHKSRKATGAVFAAAGAVSASFVRRLSARVSPSGVLARPLSHPVYPSLSRSEIKLLSTETCSPLVA